MANTMKEGRIQWNSKEAKDFRDIMALWHTYDFELEDERKKRNNSISNAKGIIASNIEILSARESGKTAGIVCDFTDDELREQCATMEQKIADARATLDKWIVGQESARKSAEALFPKTLYTAYVQYISDDNAESYSQAIADTLSACGVTPAVDTVRSLTLAVGSAKGTGTTKAETHKHNRAFGEKQWRQIFMGAVCDLMGDVLPVYKFKNILTRAERRALREKK